MTHAPIRPTQPCRWAVLWHSDAFDGCSRYFLWNGTQPWLFRTRREARTHIREKFGYIRERPDLRGQPHGWHVPQAVRVEVALIRTAQYGKVK